MLIALKIEQMVHLCVSFWSNAPSTRTNLNEKPARDEIIVFESL